MKNRKHARRVKRLALICTLCTVILVVSTYAWFIGMRTVNVSSFEVEIAATDGLTLSLDGKNYSEIVEINSTNYKTASYDNNTNTWSQGGLIPISTIGKIDTDLSRLILYEKGSLTVTPGGYRLMASRVKNFTEGAGGAKSVTPGVEEGKGFVAFDLFIRNLSGNAYYADFNTLNEEAIYLTQSSEVKVIESGSGTTDGSLTEQQKTGIENSVRVAFAQIGRVEAEKGNAISDGKVSAVTAITCTDVGSGSAKTTTGTCTKDAAIWEPNDMKHVANAVSWYTTSCKTRKNTEDGKDLTLDSAYNLSGDNSACGSLTGDYVQTYAIGSEINYTDKVDVYDGSAYNGYTGSIYSTSNTSGKLHAFDYFTDTEKMLTGLSRKQFFSLAPNSITKVRVYVYLEGQDVDNYDFASLGKKIQVNFGFTKERFYNSDIGYDGPMQTEDGILIPTTPERVGNETPEAQS